MLPLCLLAGALAQTPVQPATPPRPPTPEAPPEQPTTDALVAPPHPLITEILYAVPSGDPGDASGDGARSATGDEFIELYNPHDKAIDLRGYTLTDKSMGKPGSLKFVFPACRLQPGQCAVVFNGFETTFSGPVGDAMAGPKQPHPRFGNALVFTMRATSARNALSNASDLVCLQSPGGANIAVVHWGKSDGKPPAAGLVEEAPTTNRGSVQRESVRGKFIQHDPTPGKDASVRYSPGLFGKPFDPAPADEPETPEGTKPAPKKGK